MQDRIWGLVLLLSMLFCLHSTTSAQSCSNYKFSSNQIFTSCNDLPVLNSFLHWTYNPSSQSVKIAYRHAGVSTSRWVAWAINPTAHGMAKAQALVAFQKSDGSMRAYTSPIADYQTVLQEGNLSFPVSDLTATYSNNNEIIIFATLNLQNLGSTVNQVWQEGPLSGGSPSVHATTGPNVQSMATLNLLSGKSSSSAGGVSSKIKKKNIHGVLNAVSWGILMPIGAVIARYLKVFPSADPAWFYFHVTCQVSGYIVGVAGWATGLQLGKQSVGIQYTAHRTIGIVLFCLATIQVFALFLRPKKEHKYRFYWNIYHHLFGYSIIVLSIINIFKGFDILNPKKGWKRAYIGILVGLASAAIILEVITWYIVIKRKRSARGDNHKLPSHNTNGTNGFNGTYQGRETERI